MCRSGRVSAEAVSLHQPGEDRQNKASHEGPSGRRSSDKHHEPFDQRLRDGCRDCTDYCRDDVRDIQRLASPTCRLHGPK